MEAAPPAARSLRDMVSSARELVSEMHYAHRALADAAAGCRGEAAALAAALDLLHSTREGIDELIAEIKGRA